MKLIFIKIFVSFSTFIFFSIITGCTKTKKASRSSIASTASLSEKKENTGKKGPKRTAPIDSDLAETLEIFCADLFTIQTISDHFADYRARICSKDHKPKELLLAMLANPVVGDAPIELFFDEKNTNNPDRIKSVIGTSLKISAPAFRVMNDADLVFTDSVAAKGFLPDMESFKPLSMHADTNPKHRKGAQMQYLYAFSLEKVNRLSVEYEARFDSWNLADGRAGLVSIYLTNPMRNIINYRFFMPVIQATNGTYLIIFDHTEIPEMNARDILTSTINANYLRTVGAIRRSYL